MEKRARGSVWLEWATSLLINLSVGQIPRSSTTENPLETKHHKQDDNGTARFKKSKIV